MIRAVELTLSLPCKNRCSYCPQTVLAESYCGVDTMQADVMKAVVDKLPAETGIHFGGFGEPFQHPACMEWLRIACKHFQDVQLYTTLAGATVDNVQALWKLPVKVFVHLPDGKYFRAPDWYDDVVVLMSKSCPDIQYLTVSDDGIAARSWSRHLGREVSTEKIVSRSGLVGFVDDGYKAGATRCRDNRQRQPVILPDGTMVICCNDYGCRNIIGNIVHDKVSTVEATIAAFEEAMADTARDTLCNKCWRAL